MAIDFPFNPPIGTEVSSGGVLWVWDGVKWTAQVEVLEAQVAPHH
jgi:hypothetical protein